MSVRVLLFPVDEYDRRTLAESIENKTYNTKAGINGLYNSLPTDSLVYELTEFMDACNNQEIELEGYWLTYVNIIEDKK